MKLFINTIKFILFMLFVVWLASCSSKKPRIAEAMHTVKFDINLLAGQLSSIDDRISTAHVTPMAYSTAGLTESQIKLKEEKKIKAVAEYEQLMQYRALVSVKLVLLKVKYDSLKLEYDKQ